MREQGAGILLSGALVFVVRRQSGAATALLDLLEILYFSKSGVAAALCHRTTYGCGAIGASEKTSGWLPQSGRLVEMTF
jgi:hypothetical protein